MLLFDNTVYFISDENASCYSRVAPFHPHQKYPEYPFSEIDEQPNWGYELIRRLFICMELDKNNFGTRSWNPLSQFIKPGQFAILKPNFVTHYNWSSRSGLTDTDSLVTNGSIIRAILDYLYIAMKGTGKVLITDCPVQSADWSKIQELAGLVEIENFFAQFNFKCESKDGRLVNKLITDTCSTSNRSSEKHKNNYINIDLGSDSLLHSLRKDFKKFSVSCYDQKIMRHTHNETNNLYLVLADIFCADFIINIPKLKTHPKAGLSGSLKNLVGIIGHKDCLPHFRKGSAMLSGSDEFPGDGYLERFFWNIKHKEWEANKVLQKRIFYFLSRIAAKFIKPDKLSKGQGNWFGNDTIWRTILDINRIFFHSAAFTNNLNGSRYFNFLTIIDGIIGGEKNSPLSPSPKISYSLIAGINPVAVDFVVSWFSVKWNFEV